MPQRQQQQQQKPLNQHITLHKVTEATLPDVKRLFSNLLQITYPPKFFSALLLPPGLENGFTLARIAVWNDHVSIDGDASGDERSGGETSGSARRGLVKGRVIGGICGRVQPREEVTAPTTPDARDQGGQDHAQAECQLYIATLAVLAPWRGMGVAGALLRELISCAANEVADGREAIYPIYPGLAGGSGATAGEGNTTASTITETNTITTANATLNFGLGRLTSVYAHVWEANDVGLDWYRAQGFQIGELVKGYYSKLRPSGAWLVKRSVLGLILEWERKKQRDGIGEESR